MPPSKARLFAMQSPGHAAVIAAEDDLYAARSPWRDRTARTVLRLDPADVDGPVALAGAAGPAQRPERRRRGRGRRGARRRRRRRSRRRSRTYPGLPHRMERVAEQNGVLFVNDSKATNPNSTAPALAAFPAVHWILGGLPKSDDLGPCEAQLDHVRAAYTIGEAGPMFARLLEAEGAGQRNARCWSRRCSDAAGAARAGRGGAAVAGLRLVRPVPGL